MVKYNRMAAPGLPAGIPIFGYDINTRVYTEPEIIQGIGPVDAVNRTATRHIPIKFVPQNTLLFHYADIPVANRPADPTQEEIYNFIAYFISHYSIETRYHPRVPGSREHFSFCFTNNTTKQNFSYPNPGAGFGIAGYGPRFNIAFTNILTRDCKFAYLKSGTALDNTIAIHRRVPLLSYPNYDYRRVKICDTLTPPESVNCVAGKDFDVCLRREYVRENQIDGIIAIARNDALLDITDANVITTDQKAMFAAQTNWVNSIHARRQLQYPQNPYHPQNNPYHHLQVDKFLLELNMLCLESDYKPRYVAPNYAVFPANISVGYSEYVTLPYGHLSVTNLPPDALPAEYGVSGTDYEIIVSAADADGNVKRDVRIYNLGQTLFRFINTYVLPNLILRPVCLHSSVGTLDVLQLNQANILNLMAQVPRGLAPDRVTSQYLLNHAIGNRLTSFATESELYYDYLRNIFVLSPDTQTNHAVDFVYNPASGLNTLPAYAAPNNLGNGPTMNIRNMMIRLNPNSTAAGGNMQKLQIIKICHEVISNVKYAQNWMQFVYEDTIQYCMAIGPFYQSFCTNLRDHAQMITNYMRVIATLDPYGITDSRAQVSNVPFVAYLSAWAQNAVLSTFTYNGLTQPYIVGQMFNAMRVAVAPAVNPQIQPYLHQAGGDRPTTERYGSQFIKNLQNGFRRSVMKNRNITQKNRNTTINHRKRNSSTRSNTGSIKRMKNPTSLLNNSSNMNDGARRTTEKLQPFTADNAKFLAAVVEHPIAGPIFKSFFAELPKSSKNRKPSNFMPRKRN
jgi:hypothetical protein